VGRGSDRPAVGLIELGTSAGLLLLPDRYGYVYRRGQEVRRGGRPDAAPELVMECEVLGAHWPSPIEDATLRVAARTGIDLNPVDATDDDAVTWLRSCIWPEHAARLARLDAALVQARAVRPRLIASDMVAGVPAAVEALAPDVVPVVFTSHALMYVPAHVQRELAATLGRLGAERDLVVVVNEVARCGLGLFADVDEAGLADSASRLTLVTWRAGRPTVTALARTGPHGAWLEWAPREYPYRREPAGATA
jgi:hypothetical protein